MFHCILHLSVAGRTSDYVIIKAPLSFLSGKSSSGWKGRTGRVPSGAQQEPQGACSQILEHLWSKTKLSSILLLGEGVVIFSRNLELFKQICELSLAFLTFSFHSFFFSQSILLFEPARSLSPSCSYHFLQYLVCTESFVSRSNQSVNTSKISTLCAHFCIPHCSKVHTKCSVNICGINAYLLNQITEDQ